MFGLVLLFIAAYIATGLVIALAGIAAFSIRDTIERTGEFFNGFNYTASPHSKKSDIAKLCAFVYRVITTVLIGGSLIIFLAYLSEVAR